MSGGIIQDLGETALIQLFVERRSPPDDVVVDNGDDAAVWRSRACTVATTDSLVEGVHFERQFGRIDAVGRKLVAVNMSDIAAMGAQPRFALLSVFLPRDMPVISVQSLSQAIRESLAYDGAYLIGGNVAETKGPMVLGLTLLGEVEEGAVIARGPARPGDAIFVTGTLGNARAALEVIARGAPKNEHESLLAALNDPVARVREGQALARTGEVRGCCDISDGLGTDLRRLLVPYGLGAELDTLPLSDAHLNFAQSSEAAEAFALEGGEDYELLFAAPADAEEALEGAVAPTRLTRIGTVVDEDRFELRGAPIRFGFEHFHRED